MDIGELLVRDGIVLRSGASSKRQALHAVATAAAHAMGLLDETQIFDALLEREALWARPGWARAWPCPHARLEGVRHA